MNREAQRDHGVSRRSLFAAVSCLFVIAAQCVFTSLNSGRTQKYSRLIGFVMLPNAIRRRHTHQSISAVYHLVCPCPCPCSAARAFASVGVDGGCIWLRGCTYNSELVIRFGAAAAAGNMVDGCASLEPSAIVCKTCVDLLV